MNPEAPIIVCDGNVKDANSLTVPIAMAPVMYPTKVIIVVPNPLFRYSPIPISGCSCIWVSLWISDCKVMHIIYDENVITRYAIAPNMDTLTTLPTHCDQESFHTSSMEQTIYTGPNIHSTVRYSTFVRKTMYTPTANIATVNWYMPTFHRISTAITPCLAFRLPHGTRFRAANTDNSLYQ